MNQKHKQRLPAVMGGFSYSVMLTFSLVSMFLMPLTGFTATPGCDVLKDSTLVACYQFDGNLSDGSGNSNNGIAGSGATYAPGKTGQAISLSSAPESYVFIRNPAQKFTTAYTITGWLFLRSDFRWSPN